MDYKGQFSLLLLVALLFFATNSTFAQAISGQVISTKGEAMEAVSVTINDDMNNASATFPDGSYRFWDLPNEEGNITVKPYKEEINHLNGVSTYDLVLITRHILGTQRFENSFQMVAADTDASGTITTFDVIKLRKLILRIDPDFTHSTPWRFVDADYIFPGASASSVPDFPEEREIDTETGSNNAINFIGVKMGDVNASARPNNFNTTDDRNQEILVFNCTTNFSNQQFTSTFSTDDFTNFSALQMTISFDPNQLAFRGIEALKLAGLTQDNLGLEHVAEGKISLSWFTTEAVTATKDAALFQLHFTPLAENSSDEISITSDLTPALIYDQNGVERSLVSQSAAAIANPAFLISPNPMTTTAMVQFSTPKATTATLNIYNLNGQLLKTYQTATHIGHNELSIHRNDFAATGVVVYQLITDNQTQSGRLFLK
ncbi:MAG: T9SS type A sorting domain-containing protein [Saprospiraceae bacterium]